MNLGELISERRHRMHLTQEELAERLHVSKSAIAKWETNGGIPDRDNLYRLSEEIGVPIDEMHRIIDGRHTDKIDPSLNITPEVIAALESYGYQVIPPGHK